MNIPISTAKAMREMVGAEQIVIVAVRDGATCVATHGLTERDADEAAKGGNAIPSHYAVSARTALSTNRTTGRGVSTDGAAMDRKGTVSLNPL
jgi:hypothetical protein